MAVRNDRRIVIAADGMLKWTHQGAVVGRATTCKIQQINNVVVAYEGYIRREHKATPAAKPSPGTISVLQRLRVELERPGSLADRLPGATDTVRDALVDLLKEVRREEPEDFGRMIGQPVLEILFASVEQGFPSLLRGYIDFRSERVTRFRSHIGLAHVQALAHL